MFQFPTFASEIHRMTGLQPAGLSHSEISGSKIICIYPELIAAYHVLHRLQEPRHPPYALSYFLVPPVSLQAVSAESCTYCDWIHNFGFTFIALFARSIEFYILLSCCSICQRSFAILLSQ